MTEAPYLPPELMPKDGLYRPEPRGYFGRIVKRLIMFLLLWLIITSVCSVLGNFVWLPIGQAELTYIAGVVFVGLAILFAFRRRHHQNAIIRDIQEVSALLESGKLDEAATHIDEVCKRARISPQLHALAVFDRACVFLRSGRIDQALSHFVSVYYSGWLSSPSSSFYVYYPHLLGGLATCFAIKGDVTTAEQWRDYAHDRVSPARAGLLLPMDTLIGIRSGRFAVVVQDAEKAWVGAEGSLSGTNLKNLRLLCAFALSQINQNDVQEKNIRRYIDALHPVSPGQFDYLAVKWPELKAFLAANGFSKN